LAQPDEPVVVGKITRAHGVRGEVAVLVLSEVPERFDPGSVLRLEDGTTLTIAKTRHDRGRLLVTFKEVTTRERAMALGGRFLVVSVADLPDLPEGSWWPHEIEGCQVVTESGRELGTVGEVVNNPANDIWIVGSGEGEVLIPVLRDVIMAVDTESRRIVVREVPGLLE
jgi:16S rRNA processing protein RimM